MNTPSQLDRAIVYTLIYGDVFNFPMTAGEIHYFLIGVRVSLTEVRAALEAPSEWLAWHIETRRDENPVYYALRGRWEETASLRHQREAASISLWPKARRYAIWLGHLPFVRMVGLTGALAVRNVSADDDDLDYLLVVRRGRVWLARLFAVILVRVCRLWGVTLCPNYVLSEESLAEDNHSLFMAHEITQMIPLVGHQHYQQMRQVNAWTADILPNANHPIYAEKDHCPRRLGRWLQGIGEFVLSGPLGNMLENWEYRRKLHKFAPEMEGSVEARLDQEQVKGHFMDYGEYTLRLFEERVKRIGLPPLEKKASVPAYERLPDWASAAD